MRRLIGAPLLVLVAVVAIPSTAARASSAKIAYAAGSTYYVDVGATDGVAAGTVFDVVRKRGAKASCTVVEVAAHHAVCAVDGKQRLSAGERVTFAPTAATAAAEKVKPHDPVPAASTYAPLLEKVNAAAAPHVAFKKGKQIGGAVWGARGAIALRQQVWATSGTDGTFARPSVDAGVHANIGLMRGLYAEGALRLQGDVVAPPTERFRHGQAQLYVWDAAVGLSEGSVVGALGRFRPRKAPGMELLDGAQAGFTAFGGALEVGAFAGTIPDLVTLAPSLDRLTTGAYFAVDIPASKDVLVLPRARVGLVSSPDFQTVRAEAEGETQVLWGDVLSVGGSVRAGAGGSTASVASVDAARFDLDATPSSSWKVHAGWRYLAPLAVDWDAGPGVPPVWGAHHGDVDTSYTVTPWLDVGAQSGVAIDVTTSDTRAYAGPVLGLPRAFGNVGGLEIGYAEEGLLGGSLAVKQRGLWAGRNAYVSTMLQPLDVFHVVTRAAYYEDSAPNDSLREAAFMALIDAPVLSWLSVRGSAQVIASLPPVDGSSRASPTTLVADLSVAGSL